MTSGHEDGTLESSLPRKQRVFRRREDAILDAALELFGGSGWQAVTVEAIAARADVAKGTVYLHFASKDEIYARLALDVERETLDELRAIDSGLGALDRLRAAVGVYWARTRVSKTRRRIARYCGREDFRRTLAPATREAFARLDTEVTSWFEDVVAAGLAQGVLPPKPPDALVFAVLSALEGAVERAWGRGEVEDADAHRRQLTTLVLAGVTYGGKALS